MRKRQKSNFIKQGYINSIKELNIFISNIIDKNEFDKIEDMLKLWEAKNKVLNQMAELSSNKAYKIEQNNYVSPLSCGEPRETNVPNNAIEDNEDWNLNNTNNMGGLDTILMVIKKALEEP